MPLTLSSFLIQHHIYVNLNRIDSGTAVLPFPEPFLYLMGRLYVFVSICIFTCLHEQIIWKCLCAYLAAAPSSERLARLGGSRARLVRTPQAEKHISVLLESSSVTTSWCTEGRDNGKERRRMRTKRGKGNGAALASVSRHVQTDCGTALQKTPAQTWQSRGAYCPEYSAFLLSYVLGRNNLFISTCALYKSFWMISGFG